MKVKYEFIEVDSGDCDLGCWNSAEGYLVEIDGVVYDDLYPSCSCTSSKSFTVGDLIDFIFEKCYIANIQIEEGNIKYEH
ncbi:hypothetical protein [Salmonella phage SSBI34]|nr:hypothetical protein [Salmonella phage SSBI34]